MKRTLKSRLGRGLAVMGAALLIPLTQANLKAADVPQLFEQAKMSANQLKADTVQMETFTRSKTSWQNHAAQISNIKEHINKAGKIVSDLEEARNSAEPWHHDAIDGVTNRLKELASNTTGIIDHLSQSPNHLWDPTYQQYLSSNAELAGELAKLIGDTVEYDTTRAKIQSLQEKLDGLSA